jgi:hypothetical protein
VGEDTAGVVELHRSFTNAPNPEGTAANGTGAGRNDTVS